MEKESGSSQPAATVQQKPATRLPSISHHCQSKVGAHYQPNFQKPPGMQNNDKNTEYLINYILFWGYYMVRIFKSPENMFETRKQLIFS